MKYEKYNENLRIFEYMTITRQHKCSLTIKNFIERRRMCSTIFFQSFHFLKISNIFVEMSTGQFCSLKTSFFSILPAIILLLLLKFSTRITQSILAIKT